MNDDFLKNLKVGDEVGYQTRYGRGIRKVARITKTMIILNNKARYNKITGRSVGRGTWNTDHLVEISEKWRNDLRIMYYRNKIRDYFEEGLLSKLSPDQLFKVYNIFNEIGK